MSSAIYVNQSSICTLVFRYLMALAMVSVLVSQSRMSVQLVLMKRKLASFKVIGLSIMSTSRGSSLSSGFVVGFSTINRVGTEAETIKGKK